jgi:hypothetical protein
MCLKHGSHDDDDHLLLQNMYTGKKGVRPSLEVCRSSNCNLPA